MSFGDAPSGRMSLASFTVSRYFKTQDHDIVCRDLDTQSPWMASPDGMDLLISRKTAPVFAGNAGVPPCLLADDDGLSFIIMLTA